MRAILFGTALALAAAGHATVTWKTFTENKPKKWNAKVRFPQFKGSSALIAFANRQILGDAKQIMDEFMKNSIELKNDGVQPDFAYELDAQGQVDLDSPTVLSVHFVVYSFSGGAHPSHGLPTMSFGIVNGKPVRLKASDLSSDLKGLSKRVLANVGKHPGADWVNDGELKQLTKQQFEMFVITKKGMQYLFPPYEMGPYVSGSFDTMLKWSEIPGLKRTGPVAALLKTK